MSTERDRTHHDECWRDRTHHGCAVARVEDLEAEKAMAMNFVDAHAERSSELTELRAACRALLRAIEDVEAGRDGEYLIPPDPGCQICTAAVTPGPVKLCARHTVAALCR